MVVAEDSSLLYIVVIGGLWLIVVYWPRSNTKCIIPISLQCHVYCYIILLATMVDCCIYYQLIGQERYTYMHQHYIIYHPLRARCHTMTRMRGGAISLDLLLFLDVVCIDDRCFIKFGGSYWVRWCRRWLRWWSLHSRIITTVTDRCIRMGRWRCGCGRIDQ